jgi:hypothetical protein
MTTRIASMDTTVADESITITDEHGDTFTAHVVASEGGHTIANVRRPGDAPHLAIEVTDFGDGDAEYYEHAQGDTFDGEFPGQYVVRRTDDAGSLEWAEREDG